MPYMEEDSVRATRGEIKATNSCVVGLPYIWSGPEQQVSRLGSYVPNNTDGYVTYFCADVERWGITAIRTLPWASISAVSR